VLNGLSSVRDAIVVAREDTPGDKRLVAYLVPVNGEPPSVGELRTALGRTLPDYMVPASFVTLDRIPLTANGKLDRRALPAPGGTSASDVDSTPPRNELEQRIAEVWAELLGTTSGVHSNFFVLGGHSILAVSLSARLQDEFDVDLPVRTIFEHPTIAALAEQIEARVRAEVTQLLDSELLISSFEQGTRGSRHEHRR
jgi:acyl carrier protein